MKDPKFNQAQKDAIKLLEKFKGSFYYICGSFPEGLGVPEAGLGSTDLPGGVTRLSKKSKAVRINMKKAYEFVSLTPYSLQNLCLLEYSHCLPARELQFKQVKEEDNMA